jgi:phosphatidylinositol alpha 1,6-mannosyltransferase
VKIMLGSDTYPPDINGAARFTERLAHGLAARGHEVHVVAPSPTGPAGRGRVRGVTVHRLRSVRFPLHESFRVCLPWVARGAAAAVVAEVRPDLVHLQGHLVIGRGLSAAAARAVLPLVATNHFMPENLMPQAHVPAALADPVARLAWRDLARVFGPADAVTAPTPRAIELLAQSAGIEATAISCGIDPARYATAARDAVPTERPRVLFVGRLDVEKRVDELLRAFARLPRELPADLEIIGDGTQREAWHRLAAELGLGDRVRFRGFVSEPELLAAYGQGAVFVMPGVAELQSLVTLEAMSAGLPVVAADAMALPHLVRPGRNGWLYPPGDVDALAARLGQLLADPDLRRRMGVASRRLVAEHDLTSTLDAFEAVYERVADRRSVVRQAA